jgi:apolipoprotein N-acyltransferase
MHQNANDQTARYNIRMPLTFSQIRDEWPSVIHPMKIGQTILSAVLLQTSFSLPHYNWLLFVALIPWLISLHRSSNLFGFVSGYLLGVVFMLSQLVWVFTSLLIQLDPSFSGFLPWGITSLLIGFFFGMAGLAISVCWRRNVSWMIPFVWAGFEVIRSYFPCFGLPWGLIATPLASYPALIQTAYYGTIYIVGAWVVLVNVILASLVVDRRGLPLVALASVAIAFVGVSLLRYSTPPDGKPQKYAIGQIGIPTAFTPMETVWAQQEDGIKEMIDTASTLKVRFLLMSQGITVDSAEVPPDRELLLKPASPILFGGYRIGDRAPRVFETAYAYDGQWKYADKHRLTILRDLLIPGLNWASNFSMLSQGTALAASNQTKALEVNGVKVGPILGFESLYSDVAENQAQNGAQVLTVITSDDWLAGTNAGRLLSQNAIWRAVETGLPLMHAAPLGPTFAVDEKGRIVPPTSVHKSGVFCISLRTPQTPPPSGARPFVPWILVAIGLVPCWWAFRGCGKSGSEGELSN